jgi:hypothetical protein
MRRGRSQRSGLPTAHTPHPLVWFGLLTAWRVLIRADAARRAEEAQKHKEEVDGLKKHNNMLKKELESLLSIPVAAADDGPKKGDKKGDAKSGSKPGATPSASGKDEKQKGGAGGNSKQSGDYAGGVSRG